MKFNKHTIYISLFAVLYLIVAFSSFWHAVAFFGLANNLWMSIILAFAFEVGQAAVLFSLLTSSKDRGRVMPWVLMTMFTLVQVIGNVYSSYKYIITNSVENLRYFKEPIFIWTDLPDAQANVIIVYLVGALLPIAALLLTSMITNYLSDNEHIEDTSKLEDNKLASEIPIDFTAENPLINQNSILQMENQGLTESNQKKDRDIEDLKKQLQELKNEQVINSNEKNITKDDNKDELDLNNATDELDLNNTVDTLTDEITKEEPKQSEIKQISKIKQIPSTEIHKYIQEQKNNEEQSMESAEDQTKTEDTITENSEQTIDELYGEQNKETLIKTDELKTKLDKDDNKETNIIEESKKPSHFINL